MGAGYRGVARATIPEQSSPRSSAAALGKLCERQALEAAVRAETPKSFLDLNLDALAAGHKIAAGTILATAS